jgi:hypothetical protein
MIITENQFPNGPEVYFRWQITMFLKAHRLDFVLLNTEHCRQKYHYVQIQLESVTELIRFTQVIYFEFGLLPFRPTVPEGRYEGFIVIHCTLRTGDNIALERIILNRKSQIKRAIAWIDPGVRSFTSFSCTVCWLFYWPAAH